MSETRPHVAWELINDFMVDVFKAYGVPKADAAICADVLLESDRRGIESHGCSRFKPIYLDRIKNGPLLPVTNCVIVKETPHHCLYGCTQRQSGIPQYDGKQIEKTKVYGIAGYWTTMAEKASMIGILDELCEPL